MPGARGRSATVRARSVESRVAHRIRPAPGRRNGCVGANFMVDPDGGSSDGISEAL